MKVLKSFQLYMIGWLEPTYLAILLLPLCSSLNASNNNNSTNQYGLWPIKAAANITTNTDAEPNYPSSTGTAISTLCSAYFNLCINRYHHRNFYYNYRNVENYNRYNIFNHSHRSNESKSIEDQHLNGNDNNNSWSLEQQWIRKERTTRSGVKVERDVTKVNSQNYYDDCFELTLCMLLAIFAEVIPLSLRYVRKRTILCWRRMRLFCCCSHWSIAKAIFQRQRTQQQRSDALNCVCDVITLATIKLKKRQDHLQKLPYIIRQNQLTVFAVITGKIFALFVQGGTTPSTEILISSDVGAVCTMVGNLLFLSGVLPETPAIIAQSFKKTCQQFLLTTLVMDPVTLTFNMPILTERIMHILMPQENRLIRSHLVLHAMIFHQLKDMDLNYTYINKCFNNGASRKGEPTLPGVNGLKICSDVIWSYSHQKREVFVIFVPLYSYTDTLIENSDYDATHNNSCYLKPSENNLAKLRYRNKTTSKLYFRYVINSFVNETQADLKTDQKTVSGRDVSVVPQKWQKRCEEFRPTSNLHDRQPSTRPKPNPESAKSTNPAKAAAFSIPMSSKNTAGPGIGKRSTNSNNMDWKHRLHALIKFNLCCCFWCFYCCCRYNCTFGRNMSRCCSTWCWCWQWDQYACNSTHCIYCYYYCCSCCCFQRCFCCCCLTKLHKTSFACQYCHLSIKSNNQHLKCYIKLKKYAKTSNTLQNRQPNQNEVKQQGVPRQLAGYKIFSRSQDLQKIIYTCSKCPAVYSCRTFYQTAKVLTPLTTTMATGVNEEALFNKKSNLMQFARCSAKYLRKWIFHKLMHMADYFYRYIITALRVKISVPGSATIVIKGTREQQQQQQQQQQMICIAHDQQLKMNNLCKIFCNNWKRHRRRRRRRRRRRIYKQEQQQQQSVALQQQHISSEKDSLLHMNNIWDLHAHKTIAPNVPSVHLILSKATAGSLLAQMHLPNTKIIALSERIRKEMMHPPTTPTTSPASSNTARVSRTRTRPNLVWLIIGLVWFEGPKYVNCSINGNNQPQQTTTQAQTQTQTSTHTITQSPIQLLPVSSHQRHKHQPQPARIVANLLLLSSNYKPIGTAKVSHTQKATTVAAEAVALFKSKIKQRQNSNVNGKSVHSDNCLFSRRRESIMTTTANEKQTPPYRAASIVSNDHELYDWLESEAEADFLDEEAHNAHNDRVRLESIKRQILTKLGLRHKPNVSHPLPKQFIWDTIYRADGIRSVVNEFDFNENGSHQWEMIAEASARANEVTNLPLHIEHAQKGEYTTDKKKTIVNSVNPNNEKELKRELSKSHIQFKSASDYKNIDKVMKISEEKVFAKNTSSQRTAFKIYTRHQVVNKFSLYPSLDTENSYNRKYKTYMPNVRFDESSKINNSKTTNNFTYLMHSSKPYLNKDFPEDSQAVNRDLIYDNGIIDMDHLEINYPENYSTVNEKDAYFHTENADEHNLRNHNHGMQQEPSEEFFGDTQEIITFAEKGVFVGPQIRKIMTDDDFIKKLHPVEKRAWLSFISLCRNFLGNTRSSNYVEVVHEFLEAYGEMGCNMSIKIHFLHSHLEFFPDNLGQFSDEQGERFYQEISNIEKRFTGKNQVRMIANYCWSLKRETDDSSYKRRRSSKHF